MTHHGPTERRVLPAAQLLLPEGIADIRPSFEGVGRNTEEKMAYLQAYGKGMMIGNVAASCIIFNDSASENAKITQELFIDPLTHLPNNKALERAYDSLCASKDTSPAVVAFMDIDHFKSLNTTFGHEDVDTLLPIVGQLMAATLRKTDVLGRRSGDEFIAIMQHTTPEEAVEVLERLSSVVGCVRRAGRIDLEEPITLSTGVVPFDRDQSFEDAKRSANIMMFEAKDAGRDRVILADAHPISDG